MNCINLQQYFESEKRNTGRQDEIDLIKGFAIVFMVWDHVCRELGADISSYVGMFIDMILGGPFTAPINVFVMVCLAVIWVYVNDCWHRRLQKVKIVIFQSMSKNINRIYCIHWGIIGILSIVRALTWKERTVNLFVMSVMAFIVLIVSAVMAEHYGRCKKWLKYRGKTINRREYRD